MVNERRQRQVHVAGSAAAATAAAASAPFGAAKLRDSFRESYPGRFTHGLGHLERVAQHRGLSRQATSRLLRVASRGKPGFVPLATASTAAAAAGGTRRYERHLERKTVRKSAFGVDLGKSASHRTETAAAGGSALAAYGSNRSGRAARGHLARAADLERAGNAELHAAHGQGQVVAQRLSRHANTGAGSLPRTAGNLAGTGRAHAGQQAHLQRGLGALGESRSAAAAGQRALRSRRGKLVLAGGLAATAASAHRSHRY